jgi:predicted O-methyltransferase YrrM
MKMKIQDLLSKALRQIAWRASLVSQKCTNLYHLRELEKISVSQANQIHTHMTIRELNTLYDLALGCGKYIKVLEIGSYLGASSYYIAAALAHHDGHLFCVDTWENQTMPEGEHDTFSEFTNNTKAFAKYITPIRKNSRDLVEADIKHPLNLVFIDGDHSYAAVKNDYEKVAPLIVEGGVLAFHDCIHFEGVSRTIGEALASGGWQLNGHVDNLLWLHKIGRKHLNFIHPIETDKVDREMTLESKVS